MAATLIHRRDETVETADSPDPSYVVTGPDGTDYEVTLPESATATEVAAIAASITATLAGLDEESEDPAVTESIDGWQWHSRLAATGRRTASTRGSIDAWKQSGRPGLL